MLVYTNETELEIFTANLLYFLLLPLLSDNSSIILLWT